MKINSVSRSSFGQLYFDSKRLEYGLCLGLKELNPNEKKDVINDIRKNMKSNYFDIHVTRKKDVYIKNRLNNERIYITGNVPLTRRFIAAVVFAVNKEYKNTLMR